MAQAQAKQTRSEIKREQIFKAAVDEFMQKGFEGASMDSISARANVSKRTVYNHFDSKENLFETIIEQTLSSEEAFGSFEFDVNRDLKSQLKEIAYFYINSITERDYINLSRVVVSEFVRNHTASQKAFARFYNENNALVKFIDAAVKAKALRDVDPKYASTQFLALIKAFTYMPLLMSGAKMPGKKALEALIEDNIDMFLSHYSKA